MKKMKASNRSANQLGWWQRTLEVIFFFLLIVQVKAQCTGDYPYSETFTKGVKPASVSLATVQSGSNAATFTTNGLQLTSATNLQFGAVFVNNKQFTSANGIHIEFEFAEYGGNGADGICMFLFDAAVASPVIGANGAGLGYGYNRANNDWPGLRQTGLTGAYLGIGLDAYGNFKGRRWQGDARTNGVISALIANPSSEVTLRGAKGAVINAGIGLGNGYTGYPVLITQSTKSGTTGAATIDPTTGNYTLSAGLGANFDLHTSTLGLTPASADYRKAFIDLLPNPSGGFNVTVAIQHGSTVTTVINNYWYRTSYVYQENANPVTTDYDYNTTLGITTFPTLNTAPPSAFRIGFGASTGGLNQINLIKNLKVTLPYAAVAASDAITTCANSNGTVLAIANDIAYTGPFTGPPVAASSNVDKTSFQFVDATGAVQSSPYTVAGVGTWSYNSTTGEVTFVPALNYTGTSSVQYTIKGTDAPFNDECYRSLPATITVTVNAQPTVTVSPNVSICNGSSTTLTAGGAVSYSWNPSTGLSATTGSSVTANPAITTVYTVTGTAANGCTNTATVTVSNITPAAPTLSVTQPTCTVATGTITVTAPTGTGYTYSIDGTTYQPSTTFSNLATGNYSITAKNSDGCISAATALTVNAQPATPAAPTASVTAQPTCALATATITVTAPTGAGYTYSVDGTTYQSGTTFSGLIAGAYNVTVKNIDGCQSSATVLTINPQPAIPLLSVDPASQTICSGATATLKASGNYLGTVSWSSNNSGITGTEPSITSRILENKGTTPWVIRINALADNGTCTATTNATVTVLPEPRVIVVPSSLVVCSYEVPHLTVRSVITGTTINWQLINNIDSSIVSSGSGVDSVSLFDNPLASGVYTLKVTGAKDGCTSGVTNVPVVVN